MDWSGCSAVEIVPGKVGGVPLIRGSRVPADQVIENHEAGLSLEEIAYSFDLRVDVVREVLSYYAGRLPILRP